MFADVAFPQRRYQVFTYRIPARLKDRLQIGNRVLVPLGRASAQGLIFKLSREFPNTSVREGLSQQHLREISALVDTPSDSRLDPILIKLASQVEDYYLAPPGAGLRLILPPISSSRIAKRIVLTDLGKRALGQSRLTGDQSTVLTRLTKAAKGLTLATLLKAINGNKSAITGLKRRKYVQEVEWVREPAEKSADSQTVVSRTLASMTSQNAKSNKAELEASSFNQSKFFSRGSFWWDRVSTALSTLQYEEFLLHASQSTREKVLFETIQKTLHHHRTVLVLCPEVQQVQRVFDLLRQTWGERVGEYHGDLSTHIRVQTWHDIQDGRLDVVVGTRLSVFLPLQSVGMIWVDQEENTSFQEEQSPYYHARDVARMRAKLESATLVLGSSHPSLETFHKLAQAKEDHRFEVSNLVKSACIDVVNLQEVAYGEILCHRMVEELQSVLDAKGQAILFLNRKGFSRSLTCKDCGYVPQCTKCGVTLVLYQKPARMRCSYCGHVHIPPVVCPSCQSVRLEAAGYGTEQLEARVREKFPFAIVARFDSETVRTFQKENEIAEDFGKGKIDILIGTELLFHTRSLPPVRFVGIPHADGGLHFPDFRSAERTYHRLIEAVQLVDEAVTESKVILQTLLPTHHVIRAVAQQNPMVFYQEELNVRQVLNYPPYSLLIHIAISGKSPEHVKKMAMHCREQFLKYEREVGHTTKAEQIIEGADSVLGPLPSPRSKISDVARYILIIKGSDHEHWHGMVKRIQEELAKTLKRDRLMIEVKVNPANLN